MIESIVGLFREKELTAKARKHIKPSNFALPEKKAYPIHDISHARNALARVAQNGTPEEQAKVRKAVYAKYPSLKKGADEEANASNAVSQLLRDSKMMCSESAQVLDVTKSPVDANGVYVHEGHVARVVLITEGLGNRRNMNYYGPEAIQSAPAIFEGKPCFFNHPSESEERDIPERRVQDKFGYFKNCRVETIEGLRACTGELHFDLSEAGRLAFDKACTALHYKQEFPGLDAEYVGLSIYADGDWEERTVQWQGESLDVKYVTRFTDAVSCDLVTTPARGGRILALVESAAGAIRHEGAKPTKEVGPMNEKLKKLMEAARTALKKADEEKDPAKKSELIAEARKLNDQFLNEASKAAHESEPVEESAEAKEAKGDKKEDAADGDGAMESKEDDAPPAKKKKAAKKKADDSDDEDEDEDDDAVESRRIAIKSLIKESGVVVGEKRAAALSALTLKEAKAEIDMLVEDQQLLTKSVLKKMTVPTGILPKALTESDRDGAAENNNHLFSDNLR